MLDVSAVEKHQPEVACIRHFVAVEQHNFDTRGLVAPEAFEAYTLDACLLAEGCWRDSVAVEGVAG
jgi:hypothetical protein